MIKVGHSKCHPIPQIQQGETGKAGLRFWMEAKTSTFLWSVPDSEHSSGKYLQPRGSRVGSIKREDAVGILDRPSLRVQQVEEKK
jgi:hypothetical protein